MHCSGLPGKQVAAEGKTDTTEERIKGQNRRKPATQSYRDRKVSQLHSDLEFI